MMKILVIFIVCAQIRINTCMTLAEKWCKYQHYSERNRVSPIINPFYSRRRTAETMRAPNVMPEVDMRRTMRKKRFALMGIPRRRPAPPPTTNEQYRSLCSWTWVLDSNITRLPRNMYKALCNPNDHNQCNFDFSIVNQFNTSALDHLRLETECALIKAPVEIQNECCDNGTYRLQPQWIEWPIACACARKRVYIAPD